MRQGQQATNPFQGLLSRTSKGETTGGAARGGAKTLQYREVVPPGTPCVYFWTLNYEGRSDVTGPPLCSSKGDATEGAAQGGAKTLQYWEVVPPGTLRVYFWTLKLKSEVIHIGDFRPNVKRVMQR